jgi:hypothetical protein
MKLRKINARRYADDETGTYFDFAQDMTPEQAQEQVEMHQRIFLSKYPAEEWFGTDRILPPIGKRPPRPKRGRGLQ